MKTIRVRAIGVPVPRYHARRGDAPIGRAPVDVPDHPYYRRQIRRGDLVIESVPAPKKTEEHD